MSAAVVIGDWGNTRLRLWRLDGGKPVERREGPGIGKASDPEAALLAALGDWPVGRVALCGMAGSREGLRIAPYVPCPADAAAWRERRVPFETGRVHVTIAAGCSSRDGQGRPDVMRGEEAQVFGAIALDPALASGRHRIVLPGTHSKWVWLEDGRIAAFRTWMTGELYSLLRNSTLCFAGNTGGADKQEGFRTGLTRARDASGALEALFEARAGQTHDGKSPAWAAGFVSGLLIGDEIAHLSDVPSAEPVLIIGDPKLAARYGEALQWFGVPHAIADGEECAIAGLRLLDGD